MPPRDRIHILRAKRHKHGWALATRIHSAAMQTIKTDILIFGGGIAGLWLLNCLRGAGYSALLLEQDCLGGQESMQANGIIHGGLAFGLAALLNNDESLSDMPALWRDCLAGQGDLDLRQLPLLSQAHYLWSEPGLAARATTFFAAQLLRGQVQAVSGAQRPSLLPDAAVAGPVYRLADFTVDMPALLRRLASAHKNCIYKVSPQNCHIEADDKNNTAAVFITAAGVEPLRLHPGRVILAAGQGNAALLEDLGLRQPAMQRRPLHMVMLKRAELPDFHGHCLGSRRKPRLTITTHPCRDGEKVWYLGGELAEEGALRDERLQIEHAQRELKTLLPWVDLRGGRYKTVKIDRILPAADRGLLQADQAFVQGVGNNLVVWPCKLSLAPNLGRQLLARLQAEGVQPQHAQPQEALPLLYPEMAQPVWETAFN